jgi:hypothetical protein
MTIRHPIRFAALVSVLAYAGAAVAVLWRAPRPV